MNEQCQKSLYFIILRKQIFSVSCKLERLKSLEVSSNRNQEMIEETLKLSLLWSSSLEPLY